MNTSFYQQSIFTSQPHQEVDQYSNYLSSLHTIESSFFNFPENNMKMEPIYYPSPTESPLLSEMMVVTPTSDLQFGANPYFNNTSQFLDPMTMVPPLGHYDPFNIPVDTFASMLSASNPELFDHKVPAIELVDEFIAQHHAALDGNNKQGDEQKLYKETSWSYWTYPAGDSSRDSTPEAVLDIKKDDNTSAAAPSTPAPEAVTTKNKKKNKVTKGTTRRGRGKGVKNSVANKKAIAAAAAAAAAAVASSSSTITTSKTTPEGALYVCQHPECGRSFSRPYNLTSHMRIHTSERPYACSHCGRKFARQHDRNRHEKLHWGIRPYACHHCHKSFARMDALNRHLRMENGCTGVHM